MADFARSADPHVQAELDRLHMIGPGADVLGLDRIARLMEALGRPQDRLPPVFHIAGTNGKGSTTAFLRAILESAGQRVHVFTSPHLVRFNERIRIAGELVGDPELADLLAEVRCAGENIGPSFFEAATAAAFLAFSRHPADACVIEVGLGGRLDATNIIERPLVTGIAQVGHDHQQFLGNDLAGIAAEKAGIAKSGVTMVALAQEPAAEAAIIDHCATVGTPLLVEGRDWQIDPTLKPALPGDHQTRNANLAWQMLQAQDTLSVSRAEFEEGLRRAQWPARLQRLRTGALLDQLPSGSELWIDGGHNPAASALIADYARANWADGLPLVLLFASLTSKDSTGVLAPFRGLANHVACLPIPDHDSRKPGDLVEIAKALGLPASAHSTIPNALAAIDRPARVLIYGSLYLAGAALALNGTIPD
nr:folylpolyglutamate synthase/dihydrofolate synthase family protein [uncultured Sphingomonas sp.]